MRLYDPSEQIYGIRARVTVAVRVRVRVRVRLGLGFVVCGMRGFTVGGRTVFTSG